MLDVYLGLGELSRYAYAMSPSQRSPESGSPSRTSVADCGLRLAAPADQLDDQSVEEV